MPRRITLQLNVDSISKAIEEVNDYKKDVAQAISKLCEKLVTEGQQIVKKNMYARVYNFSRTGKSTVGSGRLLDSINGWYDSATGTGYITVFADDGEYGFNYAQVVEFGSGVVGAGSTSMSRDIADPSWQYDVHGYGDAGWVYGNGHWTKGQAPRQFMWDSYQEILEKAKGLAKVSYYNVPSRYSAPPEDADKLLDLLGFID